MLKLEIVTPERRLVDAEVDSVTVPTLSGEAGILTNHAPLISALKPGILSYSVKGDTESLAVSSGFVEVNSNVVSVLTDLAEMPDEIDAAKARQEKDEADKELSAAASATVEENADIRDRLEFAQAKIALSKK